MAFFRLVKASTYEWRSKKSGKLYVFSGDSVAKVEHPDDLTRFRMLKQQFVETDEAGKMILTQTSSSAIPMAFTRHGMVAPKSYARLEKAANKAVQASPPPANPPAEPRAPRTVTSSKVAEAVEEPAPTVSAPPAVKTVEEPAPASAHVEEKAEKAAPSPSAVEAGAAAQSGPAPVDGVPQARTRRRRSRGVAAQ